MSDTPHKKAYSKGVWVIIINLYFLVSSYSNFDSYSLDYKF